MKPDFMEVEVTLKAKFTFNAGWQYLIDPQEVRDLFFKSRDLGDILEATPESGFEWDAEFEVVEYSEAVHEATPCGGYCGTCEGKAMHGGSGEVPDGHLCTIDLRIHNHLTGESRAE